MKLSKFGGKNKQFPSPPRKRISKYLFCRNRGCKDKAFLSRLPTLIMLKWSDSSVGVV